VFAVIGLAATFLERVSDSYLLWYTPLSIVVAYFFSLRRLIALSWHVDNIVKEHVGDIESLRKKLEGAVQDYNEEGPEEQQMK
jgi:hypothetical protein